jgi:UDP-2,3-diacylglucosamine hydrolase
MFSFKRRSGEKKQANYQASEPLAIIAGLGELPHLILQARAGLVNHIIAINDQTPEIITQNNQHGWFRIGAIGEMLSYLKKHNIKQITMAGRITRPAFSAIKPDEKGIELLKMLGASLFRGDNGLLGNIIIFLENHGVEVVGAHHICADLLAELGCMTELQPTIESVNDFNLGLDLLKTLSAFDMGQAAVVQGGAVLGVEGLEGTAALIERAGEVQHQIEIKPILVKLPKNAQELRADMPAIGVQTINALQQYGFAGAYLAANKTLMLDKAKIIERANEAGLFIVGVKI